MKVPPLITDGILLAESSQDDAVLIRRAFKKNGWLKEIPVLRDGGEVVRYLGGADPYRERRQFKLPDVLLLALKLPVLTGFEVLAWLTTRADLKGLPVVVLTDWNFVEDANRAFRLDAHSYFVKTPEFEDAVPHCLSLMRYRQDAQAGKQAKMPARAWPRHEILLHYRAQRREPPCFPAVT
jgi:CheY-like chemotaxis protein